jgi:site-specific recombinase XerD
MDLDIVQTILGHASPATTAQYNDVEEKRVFMAMQKAWKVQPLV